MLVVDSSVAAAWCFKDETTDFTESVLSAVALGGDVIAPRLWAYELRNTLLMGVRRRRITLGDAQEFLQLLPDLRIRMVDPASYQDDLALAVRYNLTFYDASYLSLALRQGAVLATLDKALREAAVKAGVALFEAMQ